MPLRFLIATLCLVALAAPGAADIPPPGGEKCLFDEVVLPGESCISCSASYRNPRACEGHANEGRLQRCRSAGGSNWWEIWCTPSAPQLGGSARAAPAADAKATPPRHPSAPVAADPQAIAPVTIAAAPSPSTPGKEQPAPKADAGCLNSVFGSPALALVALLVRRRFRAVGR